MNTDFSTLEDLKQRAEDCRNCDLAATRTHLVFGTGSMNAKIVFVGEGPGEQEDLQGIPFVGPAGKLLDIMLEIIHLDRSKVYICNIVKCRPPHNRDPIPEECQACAPWLQGQLQCLQPKILVCLGRIAATHLISPDFRITRQHGQWFDRNGCRCMAMYHPSALLRDVSKRPETFLDLKELSSEIRRQHIFPEGEY